MCFLRLREQSADEVKATTSRSGLELQPLELPSPPVEHSTDHNPPGMGIREAAKKNPLMAGPLRKK